MSAATAPTLAPGQHVQVRNAHLGALPATVERADGGTATVALTTKEDRVERLVGHAFDVELFSGRGILRFCGTLAAQRAGSLTITLSGEIERIQRREFVRVPAVLDVSVHGVDEAIGGDTTTLDVSGSGIRITDKWQLPLGTDVRVELKLPEGPPLRALGRVVRVGEEADQKGIRLDSVDRGDEDRLMRFIRDREVQALRASRDR